MLRRITWRFWVAMPLLVIGYVIAGLYLAKNGRLESDVYSWGLVAATVMPVLFTIVTNITTHGGWRDNDLGLNLVMVQLGVIPFAGILAWVFLFQHGMLTSSMEAWIEIGSPWWLAFWLGWRNFIYLRIKREEEIERRASGQSGSGDPAADNTAGRGGGVS